MSQVGPALGQVGVLLILLAVTVPILGHHVAHVYTSERHLAVERAVERAVVLAADPGGGGPSTGPDHPQVDSSPPPRRVLAATPGGGPPAPISTQTRQ